MKKKSFLIRAAVPNDANYIADVHIESWKTTYKGIIDQAVLDSIQFSERLEQSQIRIANLESYTCVAVEQESKRVIGFLDCGKNREKNVDADGEVFAMYLYKEFQGLGAGHLLLEAAIHYLKAHQFKKMFVSVFKDNVSSKKFYEREGGTEIEGDHVDFEGKRYYTASYIWELT